MLALAMSTALAFVPSSTFHPTLRATFAKQVSVCSQFPVHQTSTRSNTQVASAKGEFNVQVKEETGLVGDDAAYFSLEDQVCFNHKTDRSSHGLFLFVKLK